MQVLTPSLLWFWLTVKGQKGADTLNITASSASTFDAGEGTNYLRATSVGTSTTSIFGGDSADTLEVVSGTLRSYMKGGNDSITVTTIAGGTIYGGSSLQDTAGGNDTLNVTAMTAATMIDMAGGTNYVTVANQLIGASIYGGTGNDTLNSVMAVTQAVSSLVLLVTTASTLVVPSLLLAQASSVVLVLTPSTSVLVPLVLQSLVAQVTTASCLLQFSQRPLTTPTPTSMKVEPTLLPSLAR